jgi:toxin ParE1/3/4
MVKINWSELSIDDLKSIYDYISKDSKRYALITINKIYHRAQLLIEQPLLGRIVPEFNDSKIRELIIGNYRLVYKVVDEYILDILRVYSSARLLKEDNLK